MQLLFIITLMFYNCENLLFSQGHVYERLNNLSRVIVAAGDGRPPAIIGVAEVENDSIMRRWTTRTPLARWGYRFIVTESRDERSINVGMMYQPEDFRLVGHEAFRVRMPKGIKPTRDILHAWGRIINGDTLDVFVCHLPSRYAGKKNSDRARAVAHEAIRAAMDSVRAVRSNPHIVTMGDMNDYPTTKSMLNDFPGYRNMMLPLQKAIKTGRQRLGSHKHEGEWGFLDQFLVNEQMADSLFSASGKDTLLSRVWVSDPRPFCLPFMLTPDEKHLGSRPKRFRYGFKYEGGFSDHLPILLNLHINQSFSP